ncbi:MAG TPA: GNAT family N-acetyltransferase [Pyrinomonadaceae bacterium]|jgi:GNAT superfamily N-acetyltransferase
MSKAFIIEEWQETNPRWQEFVECIETVAPEQSPWVFGEYYARVECHLLVALQNDEVAGFLRFAVQPIGPELNCPPLFLKDAPLTEAKIHAFAVREANRRQGIGKALQKQAIKRARECDCYQIRSESSYERVANHRVKLSLGFAAQPESRRIKGEIETLVNFVMPLRNKTMNDE